MVYVLDCYGNPMMPTKRHRKVRLMLESGKARVVNREPFTIQLKYVTETYYLQPITLGVNAHKDEIGLSACMKLKTYDLEGYERDMCELYAAEVIPRQDVTSNVKQARQLRAARRSRDKNRPTRKRPKNVKARRRTKYSRSTAVFGLETLSSIRKVVDILPISTIRFEVAENPVYESKETRSVMKSNQRVETGITRSKVFQRDNYTCQWCHGKSNDKILVVRHIDWWFNTPDNELPKDYYSNTNKVVTLCKSCAKRYDKAERDYMSDKKDRKKIYHYIKANKYIREAHKTYIGKHPIKYGRVKHTIGNILNTSNSFVYKPIYGRFTKIVQHKYNMDHGAINGARIASCGNDVYTLRPLDHYFYYKYRKHHDRSLHKITPNKGGIRPARSPKVVNGFMSYDRVKYLGKKHPKLYGKEFYITKKRKTGYFGIGNADGTTVLNSVKSSFLQLIQKRKTYSSTVIKTDPNTFLESMNGYYNEYKSLYNTVEV